MHSSQGATLRKLKNSGPRLSFIPHITRLKGQPWSGMRRVPLGSSPEARAPSMLPFELWPVRGNIIIIINDIFYQNIII